MCFFLSFGILFFLNSPVDNKAQELVFVIKRGESTRSIVKDLKAQNLIRSSEYAFLYSKVNKLVYKAGSYLISPSMNTNDILNFLVEGKEISIKITIPEGLSLGKTAKLIEKNGIVSANEFIQAASNASILESYGLLGNTAEGFLYPDTYYLSPSLEATEIVSLMIANFFKKNKQLKDFPSDPKVLHKLITLASIVEREYRLSSEAPLIASVFTNRLAIGMGLQSCATVEYIITEIQGKPHPDRLLLEDLEIKSDYNTYLWAGLPPGPISNPGKIAIEAALHPAQSNYLYFRLTNPEIGSHTFSHSLDEHVRAGRSLDLKQVVEY